MKIVVADPIVLQPEYHKRLQEMGELKVYNTWPSSNEELIDRVKDAHIVIVGRYGFPAEVFDVAENLKMLSVWQTGYDHVDIDVAARHGVVVSNVPGYAFDAVAEFVFAQVLNLLRRLHEADRSLREGEFEWRDYICGAYRGNQLMGKTIGVIGTGNIGSRVIEIAHGFKMQVLAHTAHPDPVKEKKLGVRFVDMDTLLTQSDVVTLHVPLTQSTEKMIGAEELIKMKSTSILINTARGEVVDEAALLSSLRSGYIAAAGLDVFEEEPLPSNSPFLRLSNVLLTPHIAFLSEESLDECTSVTLDNIGHFLQGNPKNVVNEDALGKEKG
ncbi:2-hydroxyacid dehydrogenase [Methanolobus halotolerans]|uniref:Glycerate dehydrogenase n=1 Tax=Methanolobus halotolerans TaxID=2052935 RepID=A0A4E0PYN2_9EURY|nr:2-hydroxyacid dehydrogenase [Methanolobus halotolerans]TGC08900.1 glycerate dehydrogenase [Methanolobus halotolerans]